MSNIIKISFVGDLMCEMEQNKIAHVRDDIYNYDSILENVRDSLNDCDYLVGNLETPIAGKELVYTNHIWSFNTPKEYVTALKNNGFNLLTTANNHCLDRGISGLIKTIDNLDSIGIEHTGTYKKIDEEKYLIKNIGGIKIAFFSYTYGTNAAFNKHYLNKNELGLVNLFQPQEIECSKYNIKQRLKRKINNKYKYKKYLSLLENDIKKVKNNVDLIVMCMHSGGQHNLEPEEYTKNLVEKLFKMGINIIVGCHPHVIHQMEWRNNKNLVAYSLGNFICTPGTSSSPLDKMSDYSIKLNLFLEKNNDGVDIKKVSFNIMKSLCDKYKDTRIYLLSDLIDKNKNSDNIDILIEDNNIVYSKFTGKNIKTTVKKEYILE